MATHRWRRNGPFGGGKPGYLGVESARDVDGFGLTASYWTDEQAARVHGRVWPSTRLPKDWAGERWYRSYRVRIATVTREYGF